LDNIISSQRPHYDISGLGYNQTEKGSKSKAIEQEEEQRSYEKTIIGYPKKEQVKKIQEDNHRDIAPPKRFKIQNQQQPTIERP
jgi:hypothetical protein